MKYIKLSSAALDQLYKRNADFEIFIHKNPLKSLEQAAEERNQKVDQVIRSILFRLTDKKYILVCVAGNRQIDWKELRRLTNFNRLTLASTEEVYSVTGYETGTVTPFGLSPDIPVYLDQTCFSYELISIGSGIRDVAIIMKSVELQKILPDAKKVNIAQIP